MFIYAPASMPFLIPPREAGGFILLPASLPTLGAV